MPLSGAEFTQRDPDDVLAFLEAEMRAEYGEDIDLTESSAFSTFAAAIANTQTEHIEPAIEEVFNASALEDAEGALLDRLVRIIGITRREAIHATGVVEFRHGSTASTNYTVPNGTQVQTDSSDPVRFETTELVEISRFDTFENGSLGTEYEGDTSNFDVVDGSDADDPDPAEGDFCVRGPSNDGDTVFNDRGAVSRGATIDFRTYVPPSASAANLFAVTDASEHYRVRIDCDNGTHAIELVEGGTASVLQDINLNVNDIEDRWLRNEILFDSRDGGRIRSRLYDGNTLVDEIQTTDEDTLDGGGFGFTTLTTNDHTYWDHSGERAVHADARAIDGGERGNIGADVLTVLPSVPSGVSSATNPWAMGDTDRQLTDLTAFVAGRPRETDAQLRERARRSEGALGKATAPAIIAAASELPQARSITVFENKTDSTDADGRPPHSFELVYHGNDGSQTIADMLHDTKAVTAHDVGGYAGTEITETVEASNGQMFTMHWSEPTALDVDMTIDVVVNDEFIGEDPLRDVIVDYIGGTRSDGTSEIGTGTGEDVYIDQLEDAVVGPVETGVIGISSQSYTPSTTTDGDGLDVVAVGDNEVAQTNAEDGSITLNVTRV